MDYKWVHSSAYSSIPENAIIGGNDSDGAMIYVGRSYHNGDLLVAKVIPARHIAFVSWGGEEIPKHHFEILCGKNLAWVHCYDHMVPENAVVCGKTSLDQPIYIGRGYYEGSLTVGKISSVHRALFIPFKGSEKRLETYEILVEEKDEKHWLLTPDLYPPPPPPIFEKPEKPHYPNLPLPESFLNPVDPPPSYAASTDPLFSGVSQYTPSAPSSYSGQSGSNIIPAETYNPASAMGGVQVLPTAHNPMQPSSSGYQPAINYQPGSSSAYSHTTPGYHHPQDMWVATTVSCLPPNAVYAGQDSDMSPIFVCRAFHEGFFIPGKAIPSRGCAYISTNGIELYKHNFEVLIGNEKYMWVHTRDGNIAPGAIEAGRTFSGEPLYIGRASFAGSLTPGKIHRSHGCLYIPYNGTEHRISHNYEILVRRDVYQRTQNIALHY